MRVVRILNIASILTLALATATCSESAAPTEPRARNDELATVAADDHVPACGFENGGACTAPPRCDRGLSVHLNNTPLNLLDDRCVNDTRHLVGASFRGSWADWALANQRSLGMDEPINWVQHLSTHNAYNNIADGETFDPNQVWSISDQLELGSRFLWLDIHWIGPDSTGQVRLCHAFELGGEVHLGCDPGDRPFGYALKEIATWLEANPSEIVMIDLEAWVEGHVDEIADPLEHFFGAKMYRASERTDQSRWPTRRELLAMGKQVIVMGRGVNFDQINHPDWIPYRKYGRFVASLQVTRELGVITHCASVPGHDEDPLDLVFVGSSFQVIGEDRTTLSGLEFDTGEMNSTDVANLAACNVPLQSLDMLSALRPGPLPLWMATRLGELLTLPDRVPLFELQRHLVWSWTNDDRGDGDAAMLRGTSGRWVSAAPTERRRFACARERSETRFLAIGMNAWPDPYGLEWRVTSREGSWKEGGRACLDEFGDEGFVYSVPRNGFQNGRLRLADVTRGEVWLGYNDIASEGDWVINRRPLANAGPDRIVECNGHEGTSVQLDGRASTDPEGHTLSFEWRGPFGSAVGAQPTVILPLGRHELVLIADDGFGGTRADTTIIDVVDTTPPEIHSATALPDTLWPPSHPMRAVVVSVDVSDVCDPHPTCRIASVTSSEPSNGTGDGNTEPDWRITGDLTLELRAERSGTGTGRTYIVRIECRDATGNVAVTDVRVTVSHDQAEPNP